MEWSQANNTGLGPIEAIFKSADALLRSSEHFWRLGQSSAILATMSDFVDSVRWSDSLIRGLLLTHCLISTLAVLYRRRQNVQALLFIGIAVVVFNARYLNDAGRDHWTSIASQNYFDSAGLFMATFVSGPLLVTANIIVVSAKDLSVFWLSVFQLRSPLRQIGLLTL
jgi:Transmembrane protein 18